MNEWDDESTIFVNKNLCDSKIAADGHEGRPAARAAALDGRGGQRRLRALRVQGHRGAGGLSGAKWVTGQREPRLTRLWGQRVRDAYAAGAQMDAAFVDCAARLLDGVRQHCRVYATGMGKSGVVARRLASSLASVSVSSQVSGQ